MPMQVMHWLARLKSAAAQAHLELGVLEVGSAAAIVDAADAIAAERYDRQFPVDVFQTGSGTSTNMNVNDVIATLSGTHPNDDVNRGQSSNDVVPTAVRLEACEAIGTSLAPALAELTDALRERSAAFAAVVKPGRTHLMDAVPVLLGDELESHAAQLDEAVEHLAETLPRLVRVPLGGTAVGNGLGAHPELASRVIASVDGLGLLPVAPTLPSSRMARQAAHDALVATPGALVVVATALTKICNDVRWMASGPSAGLAEIRLPALQKGSSMMPGKVNPVVCEAVIQVAARVVGKPHHDHVRRDARQLRAQRDHPGHGRCAPGIDPVVGERLVDAGPSLRLGSGGRPGELSGDRRGESGGRDGAEPRPGLHKRGVDRARGGTVRPHDP